MEKMGGKKVKSKLNKIMSTLTILLCSGLQAHVGNEGGGGGEWNIIKCVAHIPNHQKITLDVCLTGETNHNGKYEIIPCGRDYSPYVTIRRYIGVTTDSQMIETIEIPGHLFTVDWTEAGFDLKLKHSTADEIGLNRPGSLARDKGTTLKINASSMKYDLKSVSCDFGSN